MKLSDNFDKSLPKELERTNLRSWQITLQLQSKSQVPSLFFPGFFDDKKVVLKIVDSWESPPSQKKGSSLDLWIGDCGWMPLSDSVVAFQSASVCIFR